MEISKSTRHQKIIGDFGEKLVCNWLSRSGFEATIVDHTGIDVIAYNPSTIERLGISVKARTRNLGTETTSVTIFSKNKHDRRKIMDACEAFNCVPWIAIYVETMNDADLYLTSLKHCEEKYCRKQGLETLSWKMNIKDKQRYEKDTEIKHIHINFSPTNWWQHEKTSRR